MDTLLKLLKSDLRILYGTENTYLKALLESAVADISAYGITLDTENNIGDTFLVVNYAAWKYKKRDEDVGLPRHLHHRIHTRLFNEKGKVKDNAGTE